MTAKKQIYLCWCCGDFITLSEPEVELNEFTWDLNKEDPQHSLCYECKVMSYGHVGGGNNEI
jgi:hypothetical protein